MRKIGFILLVYSLLTTHYSPAIVEAARVEVHDGLRVVYLEGTPYELGRQHGEALRNEVRASVEQTLSYFRSYIKIPWLNRALVNWWLMSTWKQARPFVPKEYLEELRGLSDGSGVPVRELYRFNAIPDRTYSCSNFAAWGHATAEGRMIHLRNLDWNISAHVQDHATIFVVHPTGQHAFINVAWAGFIGVMTGINDQHISIGQVGAETTDASFQGMPIQFVIRRVLERATTVDEAETIIRDMPRTVGINYVIADAKHQQAIVLETTRRHVRRFREDDPQEHAVSYARPMVDAVFRADAAIDPDIRERQLASHGNPHRKGLEEPGGSAYDIRYLGQYAGLMAYYGHLDVAATQAIARAVAPASNIQSVIFAWPELWVANAEGILPAAQTPYHRLDIERLFSGEVN